MCSLSNYESILLLLVAIFMPFLSLALYIPPSWIKPNVTWKLLPVVIVANGCIVILFVALIVINDVAIF